MSGSTTAATARCLRLLRYERQPGRHPERSRSSGGAKDLPHLEILPSRGPYALGENVGVKVCRISAQKGQPEPLQEASPRGSPYRTRGEKSVSAINVESTFSTSFPFASDLSFTFFHSGSNGK